ncbi:hypothetical protein H1235_00665 [Pseudoxanthomonas sp. NC8]|nr:hypothetical protein H1235_00665 [Pseudoxanthomonas sp. NC8]
MHRRLAKVSLSSGGEFAGTATGQALNAGERLMLTEGSSAVVRYGNGCSLSFTKPGVYTVPATCAVPSNSTDWASAGLIAGGVAVVAAGLNSMADDGESPPESR